MRDFARTLVVPAVIGLTLLAMGPVGCAPVVSLEPIYTGKDLVFDPAALGVWYDPDEDIHVRVTRADDKAYRVVVIGTPYKGARQLAMFKAHLVKLKDRLFLDLYPDFSEDGYSRLSAWYGGSVLAAHQFALVKQLSPAPLVVFIDLEYLKKYPPSIRHASLGDKEDDFVLITAPTRKIQRFLRKAVKRGAFEHDDSNFIWKLTASKATVLHFAAARGNSKEIKQLIEKGINIDARDEEHRTPLEWAVELQQTETVAQLIAAGADVNAPLRLAAELENTNLVKTLLSKGANVNVQDWRGRTPLHSAAGTGNTVIVEMLLIKGADVNVKSENGSTPLHEAARRKSNPVIVEMLLTKGANVNARDQWGQTPLHYATDRSSVAVVELLLARGADVNSKNNKGQTPLQTAYRGPASSRREIIRLFKRYGVK